MTDSVSKTLIGTLSKKLLKIKGFSEVKVEKIKDAAKKLAVSCWRLVTNESSLTSYSLQQVASSLLPS